MLSFPDRGHRVCESSILQILFPEQSIPFHSRYVFCHFFQNEGVWDSQFFAQLTNDAEYGWVGSIFIVTRKYLVWAHEQPKHLFQSKTFCFRRKFGFHSCMQDSKLVSNCSEVSIWLVAVRIAKCFCTCLQRPGDSSEVQGLLFCFYWFSD